MKLFTLFLMMVALCACGADPDHPAPPPDGPRPNAIAESFNAPANTKQAISNCAAPAYRHTLSSVPIVSLLTGTSPSCSTPFYYNDEPTNWLISPWTPASAPPKRVGSSCPCRWVTPAITIPASQWGGKCSFSRTFACTMGPGCAWSLSYNATYFARDTNWVSTDVVMAITGTATGDCGRLVQNSFNATSLL